MGLFFGNIEDLTFDEVNVCNTSCCIAGAHAIHFNKKSILGGSYIRYLEKIGIEINGYFENFVLSELWPAADIQHAIRRLKIIKESGFVPCIAIRDLMSTTLDAYNPNCREWYAMRPEYHEGSILPLLEAKIDLLKSVKSRNKLSKVEDLEAKIASPENFKGWTKVKVDKKLYFGVDI